MSNQLRHRNTSFSYKTIHPTVRRALDARSELNNTIQVATPFVKATTTLDLYQVLGGNYGGCVGFTLGSHMFGDERWENGIVKEIPEWSLDSVRVVYNCGGDWKNYKDYTSALTNIRDLKLDWRH
jgi:hypothetical protein